MRFSTAIFFCLYLASLPALAQVSVGWDNDCDYNVDSDPAALQTALDAGHSEIRLTHQNDYAGAIDISQSVSLRGGFADCAAANSDSQFNIRSVLNGTGQDRTVVRIADIEDADVSLELLTIRNGDGTESNDPGGLDIVNLTGLVTLDQLDIRDNSGFHGGGMSLGTSSSLTEGMLSVVVTRTAIRDNTATRGGALSCDLWDPSFDLQIQMSEGTTLRDNHATSHGGAIRMQSCQLDFEAGVADVIVGSNLDQEIFRNTSDVSGGGLVLFHTARVTLRGTVNHAFDVTNNQANLDQSASGCWRCGPGRQRCRTGGGQWQHFKQQHRSLRRRTVRQLRGQDSCPARSGRL